MYDSTSKSCKAKEPTCTYEYTLATTSNTCGEKGNLDDGYRCKKGTCCWIHLSQVKSIRTENGEGNVMPIYNRISNASASCTTPNGVTKYKTLCEGIPKQKCYGSKKFMPNGCVSFAYNKDFEVKGTEWGTCGCDTDQGSYDTIEECRSGTNSGCKISEGCYKTCESLGYYSTETACLNSRTTQPQGCYYNITLQGSCQKTVSGDCYEFKKKGFYIRTINNGTVSCCDNHGNCKESSISAYLILLSDGNSYASDVNGNKVIDITKCGSQYSADTYYLCGTMGNNMPTHATFYLDGYEFVGPNVNLNDSMYHSDGRGTCKKISFTEGDEYKVSWTINSGGTMNSVHYTCKLK